MDANKKELFAFISVIRGLLFFVICYLLFVNCYLLKSLLHWLHA
jgi:hypothetical protein